MQRLVKTTGDVVVVGAGVAGCSAFYNLARLNRRNPGFKPILVDALPPLSLTSANGSFSYRNWFPSEAETPMRELVTSSIDELDEIAKETKNMIELNRNGYLFVTRDAKKLEEFKTLAKKLEQNGGGHLRVHDEASGLKGYRPSPAQIEYDLDGTDLLVGIDNLKKAFPALKDSKAVGALHVRRCGSMNPFKLGNYELTKAIEYCPQAQIMRGKVTDIFGVGGKISGLKIESEGEAHHVSTPNIVFATGPLFEETMGLLKKRNLSSFNVPIINELHMRAVMDDPANIFTTTTPLTFDSDPVGFFEFTSEERQAINATPSAKRLLEEFPSGVHVRPYLDSKLMSVWTFDTGPVPVKYPVEDCLDQHYPEACLRALCRLYPEMKSYLTDPRVRSTMTVNGGYYCKTLDNMPMIGPAPSTVEGIFLQSAMTGIGLMSSGASGQLLAAHVMGQTPAHKKLAEHVNAFLPSRFEDAHYIRSLAEGGSRMGQV
ncbi:hypothetical protein Poli38472_006476 [Pythium oligandrum]|uniref:FAD-dependent oxidoreductase domain-containing protein 1 n=1 Tax=Pythium oligandrum TaxID=41045 RepID=A0A8K1C4N9_PYTOL|nr:hypothetical protein Poli38472_006476 [Pythium oligandrum]|eukprot:TMW56466.1 hypothetical protein Poli38472_006476 [Pythium oligandrum]